MVKCTLCDDTGKYKQPNDEKKFDRLFDLYEDHGFGSYQAYTKAINKVGCIIVPCSCQKGKEYAEKLSGENNNE